jgi:drug/metabolite transporter (DMT)-like permease
MRRRDRLEPAALREPATAEQANIERMTERKQHLDTLAVSLLLACCLFWGFQQILIKTTVAEVPPLWQASLRFAGATALLWLWCAVRGKRLFQSDGTLKAGLLAGALFSGEFACIYLGLRDTTASRLTVFLYTSPFVVALLLPRLVRSEKLRPLQWFGMLMAFIAVAIAFSEGFSGSSTARQLRGDALALGAGILWGLTTLVIRASALSTASAEKTLFYQVAVTMLVAPLLSLALGEAWSFQYSAYAWVSLVLQTAVGAFASYLAWMWMLRHYPATQMSSFTFLTPVFALVFGVALLSEPLTLQLMLALAGVAAGIVLVNRRPAAA